MSLHPYPFKWRAFRHFHGILVMILRSMRKVAQLDIEIEKDAAAIEKERRELSELQRTLKSIKTSEKKSLLKGKKPLLKKIGRKQWIIKKRLNSFCDNVYKELKDLRGLNINNCTLMYKDARHLRHLAKAMVLSKKFNEDRSLKGMLYQEMRKVENKAVGLELQGKYIRKGVVSTTAFHQISWWGNRWLLRRIRIDDIEIDQLHKRLKDEKESFGDFDKEINDIYEMGRDINILMKRLKTRFENVRIKLKNSGISFAGLDKTERLFEKVFHRVEKVGKWLANEIKDQEDDLRSDLSAVKKEVN